MIISEATQMARRTAMRLLCLILLSANIVVAQSPQPTRKDIPTIARTAKGAIVTIVTANNDDPIALGSGFLVSSDGAIATNYHVIASGNVAVVKFADGTVLPVDGVLATDKVHDLAVIKVHGKTFQTLTLGNSDQIQVGEEVVAIGNPLGLELTVSNGILSGVRITKEEGKFLQTTAPISHGSSGGPLFNMFGEVVGVNALYLEGGESLNFAIPVNDVIELAAQPIYSAPTTAQRTQHRQARTKLTKTRCADRIAFGRRVPKENELGIATPSHKTPSYYIRAYQRGAYIIEYNGRQLAATCRETLTWLDGMDKPGRLMGEHDCTYMPSLVGKQIRPELMWQHDKELRYQPWLGDDTVQTADILDVTAEAPVGALLRRSSPKTSPEILKTLRWIQNTLDDDEGNTVHGMSGKRGALNTRVNLLPEVNGCQVTFAQATRGDEEKETYHQRLQVNLGDLDPTSLKVDTFTTDDVIAVKSAPEVVPGDVISRTMSTVTVHTTDKVPSVRLTLNDRNWRTVTSLSSTDLLWELPAPYAARFAKALRQAITLCGGKPSSF